MAAAEAVLAALRARERIVEKVMIVVAHPDDETIGMGAQLCRFEDALIVHATDGAPRDGHDMACYGFERAEDYAAARRAELANALHAGGAASTRTMALNIADKEAFRGLAGLARRFRELLEAECPAALFTHSYEGGHPDHDAVAFAVHAACRLTRCRPPPAIVEMALYHRRGEEVARGEFLEMSSWRRPGSTSPPHEQLTSGARLSPGRRFECDPVVLPLDADDVGRKRRMIDCFATQRWLLAEFPLACERLRLAPAYDFRAPPHDGVLHYETLGWGITGTEWRRQAAEALAQLGFAELPCC